MAVTELLGHGRQLCAVVGQGDLRSLIFAPRRGSTALVLPPFDGPFAKQTVDRKEPLKSYEETVELVHGRGRQPALSGHASATAGIPDFKAELLTSATLEDGVEIGEWRWRGTHTDGAPFAMQGVTVMGIERGQIAWGRLYMEVIEQDSGDIDAMVRDTYRPPD